jgi:predicted RNase H-like HicB family nuclease
MKKKYTRYYEKDGGFWIAYVQELPGANAQGKTKKEAQENLREAIHLILESNQKLAKREIKERKIICAEPLIAT